jgi:hypothetical protein
MSMTRCIARLPLRITVNVVAAGLACASCAPVRPPVSAADEERAATAYFEVQTRSCALPMLGERAVVTASVLVRGSVGGRPVSGRAWVGADYYNRSLRVESEAPPRFILTTERAMVADVEMDDGGATLYLPQEQQVVQRENTRALLSAVLGLPLTAHEFVLVFSGCVQLAGNQEARTVGRNRVNVAIGNSVPIDLSLRRANSQSPWTLFAASRDGRGGGFRWRAEYKRDPGNVLQSIRIASEEANRAPGRLFDLDLSLSQIQFAPIAGPETFSPTVPPDARRVSLAMVQRNGSRPLVHMPSGAQ